MPQSWLPSPRKPRAIAPKIGCHADTLRVWLCQHEREAADGKVTTITADQRQRFKQLERKNRKRRRSNAIL